MGLPFLSRFQGPIHALVRIVVGFLFACHGLQKVVGLFGGSAGEAPAFIRWGAGGIELVGGVMVMVGFQTGWAAFLCSGLMAVAYFMAHQSKGALPITNQGELAVVYSFVFLYLSCLGSGQWSVDAAMRRR